jgi:predicted dienelactone hydrolase
MRASVLAVGTATGADEGGSFRDLFYEMALGRCVMHRPSIANSSLKASLLLALGALMLSAGASAADYVAGETHRTTSEPSAAVRDAQHRAELRITIWYPAAIGAVAQPVVIGPPQQPVFAVGAAAADAPFAADPAGKPRPIILLSHGFGGTARIMGWFAIPLAEAGYIVVSVDHPGNNGAEPMTVAGAILWWERAEDLKNALETVSHDPVIGPRADLARLGTAGFSAGGFTALLLGGARADREHFLRFCHEHPDDGVCRPQREFTVTDADAERTLQDPQVAARDATARDDHSAANVKAVFAMAPALIQGIDPASLAMIGKPVAMVAGDADTVAPPPTNAQAAARLVPGAQLEMVPQAGHYAFLSTCTPAGAALVPICALAAPGQAAAHARAIDAAKEFFDRYLGPP